MFKTELVEIGKNTNCSIKETNDTLWIGRSLRDGMGDGIYFGSFDVNFDYQNNIYEIRGQLNTEFVPEELVEDFMPYNKTNKYDTEEAALKYLIEFLRAVYNASGGSLDTKTMSITYDIEKLLKKGN